MNILRFTLSNGSNESQINTTYRSNSTTIVTEDEIIFWSLVLGLFVLYHILFCVETILSPHNNLARNMRVRAKFVCLLVPLATNKIFRPTNSCLQNLVLSLQYNLYEIRLQPQLFLLAFLR
eukprot:TRINITY_DN20428_c0_g1_i1.p1 TRINITY_DN20428_c0_g1~~TRINITY_DN20428_c0_g1_i1.p1  ORF type:complete len:121 (+),score=1.52 TRINITY_DN20428_c0_g1_i1:170-532(+)